jgi:hypothetical protein
MNDDLQPVLACIAGTTLEDNLLRSIVVNTRRHDLGSKSEHPGATAVDTVDRSVASLRRDYPGFEPSVDWAQLEQLSASAAGYLVACASGLSRAPLRGWGRSAPTAPRAGRVSQFALCNNAATRHR